MEEKVLPISSITTDTKNWSANVRVVSKLGVKKAISSPTKYQKLILSDEMGTTIEGIIYNTDVDLYKKTLEESHTYRISNARVSRANDMYKNQLIISQYQWTINSKTSIVPVTAGVISSPSFHPDFMTSDQFATLMGSKKLISTVCAIIEKKQPQPVNTQGQQQMLREYAAIDSQLTPFIVSFWGDALSPSMYAILDACHKRPVIALLNFLVKGYYGLSLSSTSSSVVLDHMDNQVFLDMQAWLGVEKLSIDDIVQSGDLFEEKIEIKPAKPITIKNVSEVLRNREADIYYIRVKAIFTNEAQSFVYMCCEDCRRGVNVEYNSLFTCKKCNINKISKPRFMFHLDVFDVTGTLELTVFGKKGDPIIGMSALNFYEARLQEGTSPIGRVAKRLRDVEILMRIRSSVPNANSAKETIVYTLLAMEYVDKLPNSALLPTPTTNKFSSPTMTTTNELEGNAKSTKRKLDFGSLLTTTDEEFTELLSEKTSLACALDNASAKRRLIKSGKLKIGEPSVPYEPDVNSLFSESAILSADLQDNGSSDDDMPLSAFIQGNKSLALPKKKQPVNEHPTRYGHTMARQKHAPKACDSEIKKGRKRSLHQVIIDEDDSKDDLSAADELPSHETIIKEAAEHVTGTKTSTRGRIIKPKKFD